MSLRHLALGLGLALTLAACGKRESAEQRMQAATSPVASQTLAAPAQQKPAQQASDLPSKVARMNEDGSETVDSTSGDNGSHNPILAAVASTVAASLPAASAATTTAAAQWQEGVNYTRLVPAQPTSVAAGQVEVLEFFWYACPHCYAIDPSVEKWNKTKPAYVSFSRVHVMWSESHRSLARLYYTLQSMGKLDQMHGEIFKAIHVSGNALVANNPTDTAETERIQTQFVTKYGIPEDDFRKAYHSFAVDTALQKADELMERYRIDAVPTFVINGKFIADVQTAGGPERLISLVGDLAIQEHKR